MLTNIRLLKVPCAAMAALALAAATGCGRTETQNPLSPQVAQLVRANRELQRQVESQGKVISAMGGALILTGGGLAIVLAVLWMKGRK